MVPKFVSFFFYYEMCETIVIWKEIFLHCLNGNDNFSCN